MTSTSRVRLATVAAALTVGLTGCGVAGTSFHPGVAADIDGDTVTTAHVDELVYDYCEAVRDQLRQDGSAVPLGYLRSGVVGQLTLAAAAEQLAEEQGVEPTQEYASALAQLRTQTAGLSEAQREAVLEINGSGVYVQAVELAVGRKLLAEEGQRSPDDQTAGQRGVDELNTWLEEHDVEINPEYGIEIVDGQPVDADTQLAVGVGDTARTAALEEPDQQYAKSLPASQRCD
ncbi:hypothetical protein [Nocardioides sp. cx-173]|uniref:hypothetical protein n=1 Tax=Nocardioides sp. cx-173 TaxID=2898796 RepID=UPI001E6295B4|nr:hypothetical protein [Nocardioides sp. cx-173]MCD4526665.1 hypothetical protein [Nocardioides sp. cx-173]UGB42592.1 hypothetical protein LQ940_03475 [Nocardioides sp. cx-173]